MCSRLDAVLDQRVADRCVTSSIGPHRNHSSTLVRGERGRQPALELVAVDAPAELGDVVRVAREHVEDLEPVGVARLELVELGAEHRRLLGAVAVDQREPALGLDLERRLQHREDRRDAAAGDDRDVVLVG